MLQPAGNHLHGMPQRESIRIGVGFPGRFVESRWRVAQRGSLKPLEFQTIGCALRGCRIYAYKLTGNLDLPDPRHRRRDRQPGRRRHLDPTPPGRLEGHPRRRLLPAQQRDRLGRRHAPAHLPHAHQRRSRLPCAAVRTRPATHLPPQAAARRRPPGPHRQRLAARPAQPHPLARPRPRQPRLLDHPAPPRHRPAARPRHLPPARRPHPARAHRHLGRTRAAQRALYDALGGDPHPSGLRKTIV